MGNKFKTILVSPHSDDIAFSIGGMLLQNVFLIFLFTNKCMNVPLYERIVYIKEAR